jgi:hypothetical protein
LALAKKVLHMAKAVLARIGHRLLASRRGRFARNERGAAAVEFALLSVPFFAILGAILETSLVFLSSQVLESAVNDTSRLIRTGQARSTMNSPEQFKTEVCSRLYGLFSDCRGLHVEVDVIDKFADARFTPPIDINCEAPCDWTRAESYDPGVGSSVVMVQVHYKWPVYLSLGGFGLANLANGQRLMGAATVFKSEPFT